MSGCLSPQWQSPVGVTEANRGKIKSICYMAFYKRECCPWPRWTYQKLPIFSHGALVLTASPNASKLRACEYNLQLRPCSQLLLNSTPQSKLTADLWQSVPVFSPSESAVWNVLVTPEPVLRTCAGFAWTEHQTALSSRSCYCPTHLKLGVACLAVPSSDVMTS